MKVRGDPLLIKVSVVSERTFGEIAKFIKKHHKGMFFVYTRWEEQTETKISKGTKKILKGRAGIQTVTTILVILGIVFNSESTSEPTIIAKNK